MSAVRLLPPSNALPPVPWQTKHRLPDRQPFPGAKGLAHSRTLRAFEKSRLARPRLERRWPAAAFLPDVSPPRADPPGVGRSAPVPGRSNLTYQVVVK